MRYKPEFVALSDELEHGMQTRHAMPFGAEIRPDGQVRFRLWGPAFETIKVKLDSAAEPLRLEALADGWHELVIPQAAVGSRYCFELPNGLSVADPASRYQPDDVHGPSEVVDPTAYRWSDGGVDTAALGRVRDL